MKFPLFLTIVIFSASVCAQDGYEQLRYRSNDPFVFCTDGQQTPTKCWWPMPPYTGAYMRNPGCAPENEYGPEWAAADYDSLHEYQKVCPEAITSGAWKGSGSPASTPFQH